MTDHRVEEPQADCPFCEHDADDHVGGKCRMDRDVACRRCSQQRIEDYEKAKRDKRIGHDHEFTALPWHLGPFGRQDVHLHSCFTRNCHRVLVALGRDCDHKAEHVERTLTISASSWQTKDHEGAPL